MATAGERILVIDDDRFVHTYLKTLLGGEGYHVFAALDALQGSMMARQAKPDLIVLDVALPGGGGSAVLERLRRMQSLMHVPVLVYSGIEQQQARQLASSCPGVLYVPKTGDPQELLRTVHLLLAGN